MYLYPDNLTARPMLWLWALRDVALIGIGLLLSALALAQTGFVAPLVVTAVLRESIVRQRIHSLMNVLKGMAEVEILATDSKESYQDNRSFYRKRLEEETNPAIRALLEADCAHLDSVQTSMASARTFCLAVYYEQDVSHEVYDSVDGERYVKEG